MRGRTCQFVSFRFPDEETSGMMFAELSGPWACREKFSRLLVLYRLGLKVGQIRGVIQAIGRYRKAGN